jgi:hypothetical protein
MTTSTVASTGRLSLLDRIVRWNLDPDGDLYGDERERLRWYEGIATAASLQRMALPWAAAILAWTVGRSAVVPAAVLLAVLYIPMVMSLVYVRRRRVDTTPRSWSAKRIEVTVLSVLPYVLFVLGACYAYRSTDAGLFRGAAIGAVIGGLLGFGKAVVESRQRRRREAAPVEDED